MSVKKTVFDVIQPDRSTNIFFLVPIKIGGFLV